MEFHWETVPWDIFGLVFGMIVVAFVLSGFSFGWVLPRGLSLTFIVAVLFFSGLIIFLAHGPYEVLGEGVYQKVEYFDQTRKRVPAGYRKTTKTIVHFDDGRTTEIGRYLEMPHPIGTKIRILQKNGYCRIDKL